MNYETKKHKNRHVTKKLKVITKKKTNKKTNKKSKIVIKPQNGGCDIPNLPDWDDVNERWNGLRSGKIYNLLQFYQFINWKDCIAMKKISMSLTKKTVSSLKQKELSKQVSALKEAKTEVGKKSNQQKAVSMTDLTRESRFNAGLAKLHGYVLYDITGQIKEKLNEGVNTTSFLIGSSKIVHQDGSSHNGHVILTQATEDYNKESINNKLLTLEFNSTSYIYVIIEKFDKPKTIIEYVELCLNRKLHIDEKSKFSQSQTIIHGNFFFFRKSDTDWSLSTRKSRIKTLMDSMKINRATYLLQREALKVEDRIAANIDE
jgi:hypothetical protein